MRDALTRLRRTKTVLACLVMVVSGGLVIAVGKRPAFQDSHGWLSFIPWSELGGILVGAGLLSVWLDAYLGREKELADDHRLRQILRDEAPAMRDAVLEAFAASHEDLERVATPQLLDQIVCNSLGLRLQDAQFASEIYEDVRTQAVEAGERWYDAEVAIHVQPLAMASCAAKSGTSASAHPPLFSVTVRWEYTVVPRYAERRFHATSDRAEYADITAEGGVTSAWYVKPKPGIDAGTKDAFELLQFTVNGGDHSIRRAAQAASQTFTAHVGADLVEANAPVVISYTYQTVTEQSGHLLYFDVEQPTRNIRFSFDYGACEMSDVRVLDLIGSRRKTRIERSPEGACGRTVHVDFDGWVFPRSGVAFVWTLTKELQHPS